MAYAALSADADDINDAVIEQQSEASLAFIVAVRVRPETDSELINPRHDNIIRVLNDNVLVFDPKDPDDQWTRSGGVSSSMEGCRGGADENAEPQGTQVRKRGMRRLTSSRRTHKDTTFAFDCIFDSEATQQQVYNKTGRILVDSVFDGFNSTVFAYGATGSGKTYTMVGNTEIGPGLMILSMRDIFEYIQANNSTLECRVQLSYLEVYNEEIKDLLIDSSPSSGSTGSAMHTHHLSDISAMGHSSRLNRPKSANIENRARRTGTVKATPIPEPSLTLREDPDKGIVVIGLSVHEPSSAVEVFDLLARGNLRRTQCATDANARSSRSHAVLIVSVSVKNRTADCQMEVRTGKLSLVDLAGSERAAVTKNRGSMLREGANINRSLLALGNCINALCKSATGGHVPFRNSKLTRLLKDSLGGNCRTVMIANISPSSISYDDTQNTLKYSNRAKNIKTFARKNTQTVFYHVSKYKEIITSLQGEISELKAQLSGRMTPVPTLMSAPGERDDELHERQLMKNIRERIATRMSTCSDLQNKITMVMCRLVKLDLKVARDQALAPPLCSSSDLSSSQLLPSSPRDTDHQARQSANRRHESQCLLQTLNHQVEVENDHIGTLLARCLPDLKPSNRSLIKLEVNQQVEQMVAREMTRRSRFQSELIIKLTQFIVDADRNQHVLFDTVRQQHAALERRSAVTEQLRLAWSNAVLISRNDTGSKTPSSLPGTPRSGAEVPPSPKTPAPMAVRRESMDDSCLPSPWARSKSTVASHSSSPSHRSRFGLSMSRSISASGLQSDTSPLYLGAHDNEMANAPGRIPVNRPLSGAIAAPRQIRGPRVTAACVNATRVKPVTWAWAPSINTNQSL